ncbi:MAG TPA: C-GCAxxG-C-C family protein [Bacillota bacterium]|nr:C-GCAxxG-C-C family protein [Bacillota bacterium]
MSVYGDRAEALQQEDYCCCQCVVGSLCEEFGVDRITALRFAGAFGSGIGRSGETCGAITGAMMLIGLKMGKRLPSDPGDARCYEVTLEFMRRFKELHDGKFKCRDLLGVDITTDEGFDYILENDLFTSKCRGFIRDGAEIIADMLLETERDV